MASTHWEGTCTACGKKQGLNTSGDPNKRTNSSSTYIPGKCLNTKDGKHVAVWVNK